MSQFLLSPDQLSTVLRLAHIDPVPGSPLEGLGETRLPADDEGIVQMSAHNILNWESGHWRVNRAFKLALAVAAIPEEAIWIGTGAGKDRFCLARHGSVATECTLLTNGLIKIVFPQVWTIIPEILSVAFANSDELSDDPEVSGFKFRGGIAAAFVLSIVAEAALQGTPCRLDSLQGSINHALADPARTLPLAQLGGGDALLGLLPENAQASACALELVGAKLVSVEDGQLLPSKAVIAALHASETSPPVSFRRRLFLPLEGYATLELSAVQSAHGAVACSTAPDDRGGMSVHWRSITRSNLEQEARGILGWA